MTTNNCEASNLTHVRPVAYMTWGVPWSRDPRDWSGVLPVLTSRHVMASRFLPRSASTPVREQCEWCLSVIYVWYAESQSSCYKVSDSWKLLFSFPNSSAFHRHHHSPNIQPAKTPPPLSSSTITRSIMSTEVSGDCLNLLS